MNINYNSRFIHSSRPMHCRAARRRTPRHRNAPHRSASESEWTFKSHLHHQHTSNATSKSIKAIVDSGHRPQSRILTNQTRHGMPSCLVQLITVPPPGELLLNITSSVIPSLVPRYENIMLSVKPEVHNISQRRQRLHLSGGMPQGSRLGPLCF